MTKIDEVSEAIGELRAITSSNFKNVFKKIDAMEEHLKKINGSVGDFHKTKIQCNSRFTNLEKHHNPWTRKAKIALVSLGIGTAAFLIDLVIKVLGL